MRYAAILIALAGCYDPKPAIGVTCGPGGACPAGQECEPAGFTCVPIGSVVIDAPEVLVDAPVDAALDASIDAPIDAFVRRPPQLRGAGFVAGTGPMTSIDSPPGLVPDDFLLVQALGDATMSAQIITPVGWTRLLDVENTDNQHAVAVFFKFVGSDPPTHTFAFPNQFNFVHLMAFEGVDAQNPIDVSSSLTIASGTTPRGPSVTTTRDDTTLLVLLSMDLNVMPFGAIAGMTQIYNEPGELTRLAALEERPSAGATGERSSVTANSGPATGVSLALRPR